jgi:nucleoside-diphosphate-sugar epimerase
MALNVLVTGGAGYLGSVLVGHLLKAGHKVTVLDNLTYHQPSLLRYCRHPNFEFELGDVRDEALMRRLIKCNDALIPLAAIVGAQASDRDPLLTKSVNYEAIVLLNSIRSRDQMVVFPCTNSGYGTKSGDVYCTESSPLEPISLYGRTKVEAEKVLLDSGAAISLRLATVFGVSPRMRLDLLVNDFTYRAVTDGFLVLYEKHFKRNYVSIEDVAKVFCFSIEHYDRMKGEAYNVGLDDANLSKEELALKIKQYVPRLYVHEAAVGSDPDKRNYIVSNEKIGRVGFRAQHSLDEGIQQLIKGYRMLPLSLYRNA